MGRTTRQGEAIRMVFQDRGPTLVWEDGHDYGIYNWHYLRALCPCEADRAKLGKK